MKILWSSIFDVFTQLFSNPLKLCCLVQDLIQRGSMVAKGESADSCTVIPKLLPWLTWAAGDLSVKLAVGVGLLLPFRLLMRRHLALPA